MKDIQLAYLYHSNLSADHPCRNAKAACCENDIPHFLLQNLVLFGPTKGRPYEIPLACLSISPIFWSSSLEPFVGIFQLFFTKLVCHLAWKVIHPDFLKKNLFKGFGVKRSQNGLKMRFFEFYVKSTRAVFLISCMKLQQHEIKLTEMIFFCGGGGILSFLALRCQNYPKMILTEVSLWTFLIFCIKLAA